MRLIDYIERGERLNPNRAFLIDESGAVTTFREATARSTAIACGLVARGVKRGDIVGVFAPNCSEAMLSIIAIWRVGAIWVPLNARNSLANVVALMNDVGCRTIFIHEDYADKLPQIDQDGKLSLAVALGEAFGSAVGMNELLADGARTDLVDWADPSGNPNDVCIAFPTGGTTGRSKVVKWTNLVWSTMQQIVEHSWPAMTGAVNLVVAPMTHAAGVMAGMFAAAGSTIVIKLGFDAEAVLDTIEQYRVTHLFLPPTAFYSLIEAQEREGRDTSSLKMLLVTAAPVAPHRLARGAEVFGDCVAQSWGQAESPMVIAFLDAATIAAARKGIHPERLSSCGRATHLTQVAVMSDDGSLLPSGEAGELVVRGSLVAPGYMGKPDETAAVRVHGWHHTGDVGRIDEDGYIYLLDRKKDLIITGGFNVYAPEVEAAILQMAEIDQCAVIGVPDDKWGEAVTAIVVSRDGYGDTDAIIAHAKNRLGSVKAPKRVLYVDSLPFTPVGKIDKVALRSEFWADHARAIH